MVVVSLSLDFCRYAASIDAMLEEEETFADQMKEYLYFADALRFELSPLCRKFLQSYKTKKQQLLK